MRCIRSLTLAVLCWGLAGATEFPRAAPAEVGLNAAKLEAWREHLAAHCSTALVVVRRGRLVFEWYGEGRTAATRNGTASLAKALVGGTSLLVAMNDGRIGADDRAAKFIPGWSADARRAAITVRHLATHTAGVEDAEADGLPHDKLPGWKGDFWRRAPDPFSIAVRQAPVVFEPGSAYAYSNPGMAALAYAVTAAARTDIDTVLRERVLRPLGVADSEWQIGYGRAYEVDGLRLWANWGGGSFTPRAVARVGQWMLGRGEWRGRQLVSRAAVDALLADAQTPGPGSGLCWWLNGRGAWPSAPRDAFAGAGAGQQVLLVVPSLDLIVVRNGQNLETGKDFWGEIDRHVFAPLIAAVENAAPYARSDLAREVRFAAVETVRRNALGSDNWPLTAGPDGVLYTSYGDGWGFAPRVERKLSLGLATIRGGPEHYVAANLRSATAERVGDGARGLKASGLLAAGGVLWMWARNAGNAQLAWSADGGKTWKWGFRMTESFGSPTFLQNAPGEFIYAFSQDGASAYDHDGGLVLARAPVERARERGAWKVFAGEGRWSEDVNARVPVFEYARHVERSEVVYVPALRRYLLLLGYNHSGGWGIYEAAEPWGPWRVLFHTERWDQGGTHGYRLPAPWISRDGRKMWLVYSGVGENDAFCLRGMELVR